MKQSHADVTLNLNSISNRLKGPITGLISFFTSLATFFRVVTGVFPVVSAELSRWELKLETCPDLELRAQALASIRLKRFHAQGGSIYALLHPVPPGMRRQVINLIVAFQTISDYLDNLCDCVGCLDEQAFRSLHMAMIDALNPGSGHGWGHGPHHGPDAALGACTYYETFPHRDDGGYLEALVSECWKNARDLPAFDTIRAEASRLTGLYCDLQVYKHLDPAIRETRLIRWFQAYESQFPGIYWWEFAAAAGSTLCVFALFSSAARGREHGRLSEREVQAIVKAYFPWICGLHILLDYIIDQKEDEGNGALNFVRCYPSDEIRDTRLKFFVAQSLAKASFLHNPGFHRTVVKGLLALYLSDPKVEAQGMRCLADELLAIAGLDAKVARWLCTQLRRIRII
ncbi:MAG: tetraprenyl-beta-curcumene synthase family protein [Firmicutes bacterium]|nr:tetraprenyl-beta-curcumene synthase family protein [Bacillota bacterium]